MTKKEQLNYLISTGLYKDTRSDLYYPKKMIEDENMYVSVSELVERFIDVDKYFSNQEGKSYTNWNLHQILGNINMLVPCAIEQLLYDLANKVKELRKENNNEDGSYISLKMEHINADDTKGESVSAEISQEEYEKIYKYLMRNDEEIIK